MQQQVRTLSSELAALVERRADTEEEARGVEQEQRRVGKELEVLHQVGGGWG